MTSTLFLVMAIEAVIATAPTILLIPRARQSPLFDRILWVATLTLAFLSAWYAPSLIAADSPLNSFVVGDVPVIPTMLGAIVGALLLNGLLFGMDWFSGQETPPAETDQEMGNNEPLAQSAEPGQEPAASAPAEPPTGAASEG